VFSNKNSAVLPIKCNYDCRIILKISSYYFSIERLLTGFYNGNTVLFANYELYPQMYEV